MLDDIQLCQGPCANMSVNSISPISGTNLSQKFTYIFQGANSINSGHLLLNTARPMRAPLPDAPWNFVQTGKLFRMVYVPSPIRRGPNHR